MGEDSVRATRPHPSEQQDRRFVDDAGAYIAGFGTCRYCHKPNDDLGRCQNSRCKHYGKG
jgi:hypothetical protein